MKSIRFPNTITGTTKYTKIHKKPTGVNLALGMACPITCGVLGFGAGGCVTMAEV
jgi:hypothetical protein